MTRSRPRSGITMCERRSSSRIRRRCRSSRARVTRRSCVISGMKAGSPARATLAADRMDGRADAILGKVAASVHAGERTGDRLAHLLAIVGVNARTDVGRGRSLVGGETEEGLELGVAAKAAGLRVVFPAADVARLERDAQPLLRRPEPRTHREKLGLRRSLGPDESSIGAAPQRAFFTIHRRPPPP